MKFESRNQIEPDNLHSFESDDWKIIETQFAGFYGPTYAFVTENKGSVAEARDIYIESFIYYTQLLELHGLKLLEQAEQIIYSFSRKLWLKKLEKRRVNLNYVRHRREFYEMEDAFHEIDAINQRSAKTAEKLAEIGEPSRTLMLEHIGRKKPLMDVATRLGFSDEDRAFQQVTKCIRKLILLTESKSFDIPDTRFSGLVRYVLDNMDRESSEIVEVDKVCITMISRTVAMIRSYVMRNHRMEVLKEIQEKLTPITTEIPKTQDVQPLKKPKMKPIAILASTAAIAVVISAITAFGVAGTISKDQLNQEEFKVDSVKIAEEIPEPVVPSEPVFATAFAITTDGYFLCSAQHLKDAQNIILNHPENTESISVEIAHIDYMKDLAVLRIGGDQSINLPVPYRFSPEDPKTGEQLFSLGIPENEHFYADGSLNQLKNGHGKMALLAASPGAPVFSANGQIAGMILETKPADNNFSQIITAEQIIEYCGSLASSGLNIRLPQRNKLFYSERTKQIEQISPFIYQLEIKY